jgi:hypothetical protein
LRSKSESLALFAAILRLSSFRLLLPLLLSALRFPCCDFEFCILNSLLKENLSLS